MVFDVIDSFTHISPDVGLGLGSQITQLIELAVLDDLDHEIKERMGIKHYIRYMDDFVLIHENRDYLEECLCIIEKRLNDLGLSLNYKKTNIQPLTHGIKFLGFNYKLSETGKVYMELATGKASKEKRKLRKQAKILPPPKLSQCYQSWRSFVKKGSTYQLLKDMDDYELKIYE